ncbi:TetR/AcrR family transcriptional regulator [Paenibacillus sp. YAF4_2]|uniref:TetR/AcrR family transcriptional regulator n=1 Tax=Paenibacillus sp. YAF4_2 TaxID=3233085 RepID=UPI003F9D3275
MPVNPNDPRVKRTRQLMMIAFMELLEQKKNIYSISIQDITNQATVNRATFYSHFDDKNAFLECWMREKFVMIMKDKLPDLRITGMNSLQIVIQTVFEFLIRFRQYMTPGDNQFEPLFEIAMHKELKQLLLRWLKDEHHASISEEMLETTALVISWGIFGTALQWSRNPQRRSVSLMVREVVEVVAAAVAPVMADAESL